MKLERLVLLNTRSESNYYYHFTRYYGSGASNNNRAAQLEHFVRDECKSGRIKKLDDGLRYFDQLILERPLPSNITFYHLLGSLSKIKCYSDVIKLYKKMSLVGVRPDIYTFTILIKCFCQLCKFDRGFCFLGEIIKRGHHPNVITFSTLIKGLCQQGKVDSAFEVFGKMTQAGIQPTAVTLENFKVKKVGTKNIEKNFIPKYDPAPSVDHWKNFRDYLVPVEELQDSFDEPNAAEDKVKASAKLLKKLMEKIRSGEPMDTREQTDLYNQITNVFNPDLVDTSQVDPSQTMSLKRSRQQGEGSSRMVQQQSSGDDTPSDEGRPKAPKRKSRKVSRVVVVNE
ncbi:pentatricopeptide repeat-containing protein At1g62680, mitochondrial-like [Papaver somniferum]|uniref:pentatricopeptide repeat-containing protein At1g62680, mitochondrial-like n=1 Tax=Papaver somniferum TaxID=3469 RepID=UPI000E6F98B2|nr:pentatricopeptide repeat-containing protein At1g62680, mitochondrial-like [Papaver somniferum]